jgi:hypothetical protein
MRSADAYKEAERNNGGSVGHQIEAAAAIEKSYAIIDTAVPDTMNIEK